MNSSDHQHHDGEACSVNGTEMGDNRDGVVPEGGKVPLHINLPLDGYYQRDTSSCPASPASTASGGHTPSTASEPPSAQPKKKKKKKRKVPKIRVFYGDFVHATEEEPLVMLTRWLLAVDNGKIVFSDSVNALQECIDTFNLKDFKHECFVPLPEGSFMMPGFVDAHAHAVDFLASGISGGPVPPSNGGQRRRQEKLNLIHDDRVARKLFAKVVEQSVCHGTTCAAYSGSRVESAARLLTDILRRWGQRAFVGLDAVMPDPKSDMHLFQLAKIKDFVSLFSKKQIVNTTQPLLQSDRLWPHLLLSRPLPAWLETRLKEEAATRQLPVKLCTGQSSTDSLRQQLGGWVDMGDLSPLCFHDNNGLLNEKSVVVCGGHVTPADVALVTERQAGMVHCPAADLASQSYTNLNKLRCTTKSLKIGLGTDIGNGYSYSMLDTIRQAVQVSALAAPSSECDSHISYQELFRMATLGGASVLGLDKQIGSFELGKDFDALLVNPSVPESRFLSIPQKDTLEDVLERFLFLGDDRNITQIYIGGNRVK